MLELNNKRPSIFPMIYGNKLLFYSLLSKFTFPCPHFPGRLVLKENLLQPLCDAQFSVPCSSEYHHRLVHPTDDDIIVSAIVKGNWGIPLRNPPSF